MNWTLTYKSGRQEVFRTIDDLLAKLCGTGWHIRKGGQGKYRLMAENLTGFACDDRELGILERG